MNDHHVSLDVLDWANAHIHRHGDTDIFPVPFEYEIVANDWETLRPELQNTHIGKANLRAHRTFEVPKTTFGFRVAHQLDPLDSILYAAMVYEMGDLIEATRLPPDTVCSYRFQPTSAGDFYPQDNGWRRYATRSRELALATDHILYVDISDFYNQIYHHRIAGSLETCGVSSVRARNVEKFLARYTAKQSRGLPVGPSCSHLLAEGSLSDVDSFLDQRGVPFVRYVDDFRVFSDSTPELVHLLQELTGLLHSNHGLALQTGKTELNNTLDFVRTRLDDPGQEFNQRLDDRLKKLAALLSELSEEMGYGSITITDIPDAHVAQEAITLLHESFKNALKAPRVPLGLLKFLLREAKSLQSDALLSSVLDNLHSLIPIMGDVCRYIQSVCPKGHSTVADRILTAVSSSDYVSSAFVAQWVLDLFVSRPDLVSFQKSLGFAQSHQAALGLRPQALLAKAHSQPYLIRSLKPLVANLRPWDRRAAIYAASVLPQSEKNAWLTMVKNLLPDPLEAAVARSM